MFEELINESKYKLEEEFYKKPFKFSYSSLNTLLYSPKKFYELYVLGHKEDILTPSLIKGKAIHMLLLEEEKFSEHFTIFPNTAPKGTVKDVIDILYSRVRDLTEIHPVSDLEDFKEEILNVMKDINYYQNLKTDEQRLSKIITEETKSYFDFLKNKGDKIILDQSEYDYCVEAVNEVRKNKKVLELLGQDDASTFKNIEVYNEHYLEYDFEDNLPFGFKSILDNVKIDHEQKIIYINDFKTTSKNLKDFKDSVEYYRYDLQAVMYSIAVIKNFLDLMENGYNLQFHFIVIDNNLNVYPFPVTEKTLNEWLENFKEAVERALYHYNNKSYQLPYEFEKELVVL